MDITRIPEPTEKDYARIERYKKEYKTLIEALDDIVNNHELVNFKLRRTANN